MVNEEAKQVSAAESERLAGIISELSVGEVKCDKCGKAIRHLGRYCLNTRECYHCKTIFNTIAELNGHFIEKHSPDPTRGTRYCLECSRKAGFLRTVHNKKTGEIFQAMLVLRDEELIPEADEKQEKAGKAVKAGKIGKEEKEENRRVVFSL